MRIDLPLCNLKTCRYSFDGNCTDKIKYEECEYTLAKEERPHGEWEKYGGKIEAFDIEGHKTWGQKRKCTNCGFIKTYIEDFGFYSICPNCGSDNRRRGKAE